MKNFFGFVSKKNKPSAGVIINNSQDGAYSISMEFEDHLILTSDADSFSEHWVNKELKRSKLYFYKQLKEA